MKRLLIGAARAGLPAACVLAAAAAPAVSGERPLPDPVGYGKRIFGDIKELPSKPGSWSKGQWLLAGSVVAATGGSLFVDDSVADYYDTHRQEYLRNISMAVTHFGDSKYQVPVISGLWVTGYALGSMKLRKIAADATEASMIAALMINPTINYLTGRALPSSGESPSRFKPFTWHRYSFPSGHTAAAFALASVLDVDLRDTFGYWHLPIVYGGAIAVANSRLYDRKHYLSEVILGGAIGWAVGTWVASKDREAPVKAGAPAPKEPKVTLRPYHYGLLASMKF
ncbi:MAG: phosphatase PAP2 family protein [Elusimicrobia bacterium]|nr:phosphatase PAP2 family protein [Elusimicrobiota bacterium]